VGGFFALGFGFGFGVALYRNWPPLDGPAQGSAVLVALVVAMAIVWLGGRKFGQHQWQMQHQEQMQAQEQLQQQQVVVNVGQAGAGVPALAGEGARPVDAPRSVLEAARVTHQLEGGVPGRESPQEHVVFVPDFEAAHAVTPDYEVTVATQKRECDNTINADAVHQSSSHGVAPFDRRGSLSAPDICDFSRRVAGSRDAEGERASMDAQRALDAAGFPGVIPGRVAGDKPKIPGSKTP
jgi:hypothetical protein